MVRTKTGDLKIIVEVIPKGKVRARVIVEVIPKCKVRTKVILEGVLWTIEWTNWDAKTLERILENLTWICLVIVDLR